MKNDNIDFTLIVPIYNEINAVEKTIQKLQKIREKNDFEIILVNDCSNDGTENILNNYSSKGFKIIHQSTNRGYGAAIKAGIKYSKYPIIAIADADGTYPVDRLPELINALQEGNFDMVVGARVGQNVNIPLIRRPAKWFITKLASYLTGTKIPDINSGLRVMKKDVVEKYLSILPDGFSLTSTITLAMLTNDYRVKYVLIDYFKRKGKSKIKPIQDTLNFIQLVIRTVMYFNPLKIFIPLSLFLVFLAFFVLLGSWLFMGKVMDVTFGVILMTSVMVMAIGMLADLIDKRIGK